jgi:hypothetical protein
MSSWSILSMIIQNSSRYGYSRVKIPMRLQVKEVQIRIRRIKMVRRTKRTRRKVNEIPQMRVLFPRNQIERRIIPSVPNVTGGSIWRVIA